MKLTVAHACALCLFAAFVANGSVASGSSPGVAYDEIARVVIGQATPPPPDGFKSDLAAITNASTMQTAQQPPKKHGFGNLLGAVLSGQSPIDAAAGGLTDNLASNAMAGLMGSMSAFTAFMREGKLAHYTFYNGWERVDDTDAQTATITKYDRHQIIFLDLQKKTYRVSDPSARTTEPANEATATPTKHAKRTAAPPEEPGTALVDFSRYGSALGPAVLDGVATSGYANKVTLAMTQATGSCRNGSFSIGSSQYYSKLLEPQIAFGDRPAVAERPASRVPTDPRGMVSRGGCMPTFTAHDSGATPPSGRFMMYSNVALQPPTSGPSASGSSATGRNASDSPASSFAFVTERGNVQSLSASTAAPLFEIPPGFVPAQ